MLHLNNKILKISKLKKDGSLDASITKEIAAILHVQQSVIMPVDGIYGIVSTDQTTIEKVVSHFPQCSNSKIEQLVSSFKMVDHLVQLEKLEYDFLHRIWPGEITVLLNSLQSKDKTISMRIPKSRYMLDVIDLIEKELYHISLYHLDNSHIFKKDAIIKGYEEYVDKIVIITEFCKEHTVPSVIDIRNNTLDILEDGRVSSEEIKSLYFL